MEYQPDISVVTPSFQMLEYLPQCHRSVKDQEGVAVEHIVMDAQSTDGTVEWLEKQPDVKWRSEPDEGMYDAVNKGWQMASGDIIAYLNCDEQYLPGTLHTVNRYFDEHPDVDMVFGDTLLTNPKGELLAFRKSYTLRTAYIYVSHLYALSCAMFFRRRVFDDGFVLDTRFKDVADTDFVLRILKSGRKVHHLKRYLSVFTWTGSNMSTGDNARAEASELYESTPHKVRKFRKVINIIRLLEKGLSGAYFQKFPLEYRIYTGKADKTRTTCVAGSGSWKWPD